MTRIEGENTRVRHYLARLHRCTLCYSKSLKMLKFSIKLLLHYLRYKTVPIQVIIPQFSNASLRVNPATTQIIGHSLGAHIAGITADVYEQTNRVAIDSVIGLDPAGPFIDRNNLATRLDANDARRVSALHTDGGTGIIPGAGYYARLANFDFFVNGGRNQPNGDNHGYAHVLFDQLLNGASFRQPPSAAVGPTFDLAVVNGTGLMEGGYDVTTLLQCLSQVRVDRSTFLIFLMFDISSVLKRKEEMSRDNYN